VIQRSRMTLAKLPSKAEIEPLIDRLLEQLKKTGGNLPETVSPLHEVLVQPIAGWDAAQRVYVVPDGKLHQVPFELLLNKGSTGQRIVATVPSANAFALLRTRPSTLRPERALMAIGGVPYDRMFDAALPRGAGSRSIERGVLDASYPTKLPVLPTSEAEVLTAARLLGPTSVVLTGDRATESALKAQRLDTFDVLHFAVHAFADPKFPERAALVLLNDPATGDDGLLQPREIGQFRLNASLVVLSACDTAV